MRKLFWGGIHPEGHKALSRGAAPIPAPLPAQVVLPMVQHIGAACTPVVKVGDEVKAKIIGTEKGKISLSMKALLTKEEVPEREPVFNYKEEGRASTNLGDLLKNSRL